MSNATESTQHTKFEPEHHQETPVKENRLFIGAFGLEHGHIYSMCKGMKEAGATIRWVWDEDPKKIEAFQQVFPEASQATSLSQILQDQSVQMVASAAIPSTRCDIGLQVLDADKHFFSAKAPFTTMSQLRAAEQKVKETGLHWAVFYSERLQVECAGFAEQLIDKGAIGDVVQVLGMGPHRLNIDQRPEWFFWKETYGGIVCDIGSHQIEQFLWFAKANNARILSSTAINMSHPEYPEFEDYGDAHLVADNGAVHYFRVDWFTPDGLRNWGDGRTTILGTDGYIELRKYIDITHQSEGEQLYLVNHGGERKYGLKGKVGYPYFYRLAHDVLENTSNAMPQNHIFKAAELCLLAQEQATNFQRKGGEGV
ncbi:Gfo/Idh/MocA family protein [Halobacillus naozhouensis]|uniref:Gfo/Idh/MocA family oxidoreductase n=1 Tax=Halobacillus naozhouensis TaxID=554880 RepID=A0ABY8IXT1_9BACI|nr:Gfo/Idh/MocA family oxidoreductase [Halobacillus naozhouensis]WFT74018.1 Gfo/Idh/MocA family oxidoreductase [Halobacillus naozhouensis]